MSEQMKRITRAMTELVLSEPFFATLAFRLSMRETSEVDSFATDGRELLINPEFCAKLTPGQIKSVIAHEVLHCAMGHVWRAPSDADREGWNMAADQEANGTLLEANAAAKKTGRADPFPLPDGYFWRKDWDGWAAERVYRAIPQNPKDKDYGAGTDGSAAKNGMGAVIPQPRNGKGAVQLREEWNRAVVQAATVAEGRGTIPQSMRRLVEKITKPAHDWRALLKDFLRDVAAEDWSWERMNRRYLDTGFMLPGLHSEKAGKLVFAVDTSGSIGAEALSKFIAEAQAALDELSPEDMLLVACDSVVKEIRRYKPGDRISGDLKGGGGTDFRPVFKALAHEETVPAALVYLTDMDGTFPDDAPDYPVMWIATTDRKAPWGETVKYQEQE